MILTGNLDVWIEPILEELGMRERCVCSGAVVCNGHIRDIAYVPDKGKVCGGLQRPFIAIGAGSNDVDMLKTADVVIMDENELISYLTGFF